MACITLTFDLCMIWASRNGEAFSAGFTNKSLAPLETARNISTILGSNVNGEEANKTSDGTMFILCLKSELSIRIYRFKKS